MTIGRPAKGDPMRRRTLLTSAGLTVPQWMLARFDDALVLLPDPARQATPAEIAGRLARARAWFDASDLVPLMADLPDLLATAHQAAEHDSPDTAIRLAACYNLATEALSKIGHYGASRITADRDRALELITQAERVAARLPEHPIAGQLLSVTPAQVTLYRVGVHWSLGDAGAALHAGRGLHPGQFPTPERRGRLHTDLARAWWQWGKPDQAAHALLAAHRQAPAEVRDRPSIRTIVTDLLERHPRVASVRELAVTMGHHAIGR